MLNNVKEWYESLYRASPWNIGYALGRSLIALGSLLTLLFTPSTVLFAKTSQWPPGRCSGFTDIFSLYCLGAPFELMRWISVAVLLLVVVGWRPRITALPHAWVAVSLQASLTVIEGGDQIAGNISLLLLPAALCDNRRHHWHDNYELFTARPFMGRMFANVARSLVRAQVCIIYLHSFVGKAGEEAWLNGTVIYYWVNDPKFGTPGMRKTVADLVVSNPFLVTLVTWGSLVIELLLSMAMFASWRYRRSVLPLGLALHSGIAVFIGLTHFSIIMFGALLLYLLTNREQQCTNQPAAHGEYTATAQGERHE